MEAADVQNVCRLCPANKPNMNLIDVFGEKVKKNLKEVIFVTTGIEILESDLMTKKICQRCFDITGKMYKYRQDAFKQNKYLKEKCRDLLEEKGLRIPNTSITVKQEKRIKPEPSQKSISQHYIHPSIKKLYDMNPKIRLPKSFLQSNFEPIVSLTMGEVEEYFKSRKLNIQRYIYKPRRNTAKHLSKKFARKSTSALSRETKTVSPLKISKKLLGIPELKKSSDDEYVCSTYISERKRSLSPNRSEEPLKLKLSKVLFPEVEEPPTASDANNAISSSIKNDLVTTKQSTLTTSENTEELLANMSDLTDVESGNTSESTVFDVEQQKEEFSSTPKITTTKSHTLVVCNWCGNFYHNAFELKRHSSKHMVCQFCKQKFKSIESKENHVNNNCEIKIVLNSSGPSVHLERIHLNSEIRRKFKEAFVNLEPIPEIKELAPLEEVIVRVASPLPPSNLSTIIVLSDEEDISAPADPFSDIPTLSACNLPDEKLVTYTSTSIVRPDVRVKNTTIIDHLTPNINDTALAKELINFVSSSKVYVDMVSQTDLPSNNEIAINSSDSTCAFKNLKSQLLSFKIPVQIKKGSFNIGYNFDAKQKSSIRNADWSHLPIIDVKDSENVNQKSENVNQKKIPVQTTQAPPNLLLITTSSPKHQQFSNVAGITFTLPNMRGQNKSGTPVSTVGNAVASNVSSASTSAASNVSSANTSDSPTPLLQNFLTISNPVSTANKSIPFPRPYVNAAINNRKQSSNLNNYNPASSRTRASFPRMPHRRPPSPYQNGTPIRLGPRLYTNVRGPYNFNARGNNSSFANPRTSNPGNSRDNNNFPNSSGNNISNSQRINSPIILNSHLIRTALPSPSLVFYSASSTTSSSTVTSTSSNLQHQSVGNNLQVQPQPVENNIVLTPVTQAAPICEPSDRLRVKKLTELQ